MIPGLTLDPHGGGRLTVRWDSGVVGELRRDGDLWQVRIDGWVQHPPFDSTQDAKRWMTERFTADVRDAVPEGVVSGSVEPYPQVRQGAGTATVIR